MAETSLPWANTGVGDGQAYDDDEWSDWQRKLFSHDRTVQGVIPGYENELAVSNPAGNTIRVATGAALVDGKIYEADPTGTDDDGVLIKTEWLTPWVDNDTTDNKILDSIRFHLKRGQAALGQAAAIVSFKYRNNGSLVWKNERQLDLFGSSGEYDFYRRITDLGEFRSRQFSISLTDAAKLILVKTDWDIRKGWD